jgi:hypothetical protein
VRADTTNRPIYDLMLTLGPEHNEPDHDEAACFICRRIWQAMVQDTAALFRRIAEARR